MKIRRSFRYIELTLNNIVKNDLFRIGEDFRRSANDLNNSYKNIVKMSNEQQK